MQVSFLTQYASEGYVLAFEEGIDVSGGKELDNVYHSENLNTDVIIYKNDWNDTRLTAIFEHDDILYE